MISIKVSVESRYQFEVSFFISFVEIQFFAVHVHTKIRNATSKSFVTRRERQRPRAISMSEQWTRRANKPSPSALPCPCPGPGPWPPPCRSPARSPWHLATACTTVLPSNLNRTKIKIKIEHTLNQQLQDKQTTNGEPNTLPEFEYQAVRTHLRLKCQIRWRRLYELPQLFTVSH